MLENIKIVKATNTICDCMHNGRKQQKPFTCNFFYEKRLKNNNLLMVRVHTYFYIHKPFTKLVNKICFLSYIEWRLLHF